MKQTITTCLLSAAAIFALSGCGNSDSKKETAQQAQPSTVSIEKRKQAFDSYIHSFSAYGFDVNRTKDSDTQSLYLLTVADAPKAAQSLLRLFNMNTLDAEDQAKVSEAIANSKIGVETDWKKYSSNAPESVFVYYIGNGKEGAFGKQLVDGKKIGAYLTYDAADHLKKARIKDLDETYQEGTSKVHTILKGAHIDVRKTAADENAASAYDIFGGQFALETTDTNTTETFHLGYKDPECHIDKQNFYLGKETCTFPVITVRGKEHNDITVTLNNTAFDYVTSEHDKKVRTDMKLTIADIVTQIDEGKKNIGNFVIKGFKIDGYTDNVDSALIKSFYELTKNPPKEQNETIAKTLDLVGKLYGSGLTFNYTASLKSAEGKGKGVDFALDNYSGTGHGTFDANITYEEKSQVEKIILRDIDHNQTIFDLKNFKLGYGVKGLYNFLPDFMAFSAQAAQQADKNAQLTPEMEQKLTHMGEQLVHNGFEVFLAPVGFDAVHANGQGKTVDLGKLDFNINAKLLPNNAPLNMNNPMAALMLMPYLQADGKLVLPKKDLEMLSKNVPPQMVMMLMMFAKYEGDNAVFVLKFENGHMLINGQPMM